MQLKAILLTGVLSLGFSVPALAADYTIDTEGMHASIMFRFKHLGYSWLTGGFKKFDGTFSYDPENPEASSVNVSIDVSSLDSNHALRDKHIRGDKFLDTDKFPSAKFVSTGVQAAEDGSMKITGDLTLHGVTKQIVIDASKVGEGKDPWGGYRAGFEGHIILDTSQFGVNLMPSSDVELFLNLEGVRK